MHRWKICFDILRGSGADEKSIKYQAQITAPALIDALKIVEIEIGDIDILTSAEWLGFGNVGDKNEIITGD